MTSLVKVLTASLALVNVCAADAPPASPLRDPLVASAHIGLVDTSSGKVRGFVRHGTYTYRGIPYAHAARFMPPEPPARWEGVRTALTYGFVCPQADIVRIDDQGEFLTPHRYGIANEECQNLNIWTPSLSADNHRPVMVWIHGGGFTNGSSIEQLAYDGENLSRKGGVVVVSVNHRLNVTGFLDLSAYGPQYRQSGNAGIMDLVAALQWIRVNIANFGGDPMNVTIFGQSGGGGKVTTLMATPAAHGLFQKAIVESGSLRGMGMTLNDSKTSRRVAELTLRNLGLQPSQVDQLQSMPYRQLNEAAGKALKMVGEEKGSMGLFGDGIPWAPTVDGEYIPAQPMDTAAPAQSRDIPLLVGTTLNEFPLVNRDPAARGASDWNLSQVRDYLRGKYGDRAAAVEAAFRRSYPEMRPADWLYVDRLFRPGAIAAANLKSDQRGAPVFAYLFAWQSPIMDGVSRATHCMEIPFVFNNIALADQVTGGGSAAEAMADKVSRAWIHFARSGDPTVKGIPLWPAYTRDNGATMVLDNSSHVVHHHDDELMSLIGTH